MFLISLKAISTKGYFDSIEKENRQLIYIQFKTVP
jgi:hypothetical protein